MREQTEEREAEGAREQGERTTCNQPKEIAVFGEGERVIERIAKERGDVAIALRERERGADVSEGPHDVRVGDFRRGATKAVHCSTAAKE